MLGSGIVRVALRSYRETDHVFIGRKIDVFLWPGSRTLQDGCCSKQIEELIDYGQSKASFVGELFKRIS